MGCTLYWSGRAKRQFIRTTFSRLEPKSKNKIKIAGGRQMIDRPVENDADIVLGLL